MVSIRKQNKTDKVEGKSSVKDDSLYYWAFEFTFLWTQQTLWLFFSNLTHGTISLYILQWILLPSPPSCYFPHLFYSSSSYSASSLLTHFLLLISLSLLLSHIQQCSRLTPGSSFKCHSWFRVLGTKVRLALYKASNFHTVLSLPSFFSFSPPSQFSSTPPSFLW